MNPLKIVIAEDDEDEILFMKEGFIASGLFEIVYMARNGEDLIDTIRSMKDSELPDLILSDLNMPKKTGYDVLKELKEDSACSHIPIIIISTSSTPTNIDRCYVLGAYSYLIKPDTFNDYEVFAKKIYQHIKETIKS